MDRNTQTYAGTLAVVVNDQQAYDYRVCLPALLPIPLHLVPRSGFRNEWLRIADHGEVGWFATLSAGYSWDGCTGACDFALGVRHLNEILVLLQASPTQAVASAGPLLGSLAHDPIYQFVDEISHAWGVNRRTVLAWADAWFAWTMLEAGTPRGKAGRYYLAVKYFGYVFNLVCAWLRRLWKRGKQ